MTRPAGTPFAVTAAVVVSSAGLHVVDRWTDTVVEGLRAAGAGDPDLSGSLTGGRFEITMTVDAAGVGDAAAVAAEALRSALAGAEMPGLRVRSLTTSVEPA